MNGQAFFVEGQYYRAAGQYRRALLYFDYMFTDTEDEEEKMRRVRLFGIFFFFWSILPIPLPSRDNGEACVHSLTATLENHCHNNT